MKEYQDAFSKLKSKGLISEVPSKWYEKAKRRAEEKPWKRRSQAVALMVLRTLRAKKITQKELAERIGVSPQQVNKWVKGNENFTFETIARLENALDIQLMRITGFEEQTVKSEGCVAVESTVAVEKSHEPTEVASIRTMEQNVP